MSNLEIIKSTYDVKSLEERRQKLAEYAVDDISWTEAKGFPYAGTYIGLESIMDNVHKRLATEWIGFKFSPEDYIADEDKVVVIGTYSGTYKQTQKYFEARVAHFWELNSGKISSFEQLVDSKTVVDAMR